MVKADADQVERAARLAKADLVTGMVGEFPELQGVIGGYLAEAQGEPHDVADAIRDHYKPVGQGDEVPTAPVTVAVALADKLDTLGRFFGSRRSQLVRKIPLRCGELRLARFELIVEIDLRAVSRLSMPIRRAASPIRPVNWTKRSAARSHRVGTKSRIRALLDFFADRLKVQQREAGVRHDLIDAVFALGGEDDSCACSPG